MRLQAPRYRKMNTMAPYLPPYRNNLTRFTSDIDDSLQSPSYRETNTNGGDLNISLLVPDSCELTFIEAMFSSIND